MKELSSRDGLGASAPNHMQAADEEQERLVAALQVVITSYDMLGRLTCKACVNPGKLGEDCPGPESCMAVRAFKVHLSL